MSKNIKPYPPPFLSFPIIAKTQKFYFSPKKITTYEFYSVSDGCKRIYTEKDALTGYGQQKILDPNIVSYINLFINGVLQPKKNYEIKEGKISILTDDIPIKGTPIILQMIKL